MLIFSFIHWSRFIHWGRLLCARNTKFSASHSVIRITVYLSEDERFLVVDRIKAVVGNRSCPKLLAYRVRRQSIHVHLNVRANFLVRQKLSGDYLQKYMINWKKMSCTICYETLCIWIQWPATHKINHDLVLYCKYQILVATWYLYKHLMTPCKHEISKCLSS